ncbi:winged helix-turn-helix domain-containing protein [Phyllobacterium sp. 628]|nr:winged helix-turn-helix domain-containing protein [Phyllobacterium sp. 628]
MSQSDLARSIGSHRSKISRALSDEKGLITGRDQERLIELAEKRNVPINSDDLTPALK